MRTMGECIRCGKRSRTISSVLSLCADCIKGHYEEVKAQVERAHTASRKPFHLPATPPKVSDGRRCNLCLNECVLEKGTVGYCGLHIGGRRVASVSWYDDPLPTNCVASWVCPAGTGVGYPDFAYSPGPEYGYFNLAVFYHACTFNCLFCQNWHFKRMTHTSRPITPEELARAVHKRIACICYFGGDPTPFLPHAIMASKLALKNKPNRILRICWETNGSAHPKLLRQMVKLSLESGGCIKFDLKAWDEKLHIALCGVSNKRTLENFAMVATEFLPMRPQPPLLVASTLLVPGYVDEDEVSAIANFIAQFDPNIPYSLLAFAPQFYMSDLPTTSRTHALRCLEAAKTAGLSRVHIGNVHLLSSAYH